MIFSFFVLAAATAAVFAYTWLHRPESIPAAVRFTRLEIVRLGVRLPFALVAASCLSALIPQEMVGALIGRESGLVGILVASFAGGLLPGGPMVSFPLALVLAGSGAGTAQLVALITGWSVFAFHRVISYEGPIMGWTFVALRLLSAWMVPVIAGLAALAATHWLGELPVGWAAGRAL